MVQVMKVNAEGTRSMAHVNAYKLAADKTPAKTWVGRRGSAAWRSRWFGDDR